MGRYLIRFAICFLLPGAFGSLQAGITTYTGIDLNTNPDAKNTALTSFPNASGAEADFLSQLVDFGTETFEGFSTVSGPVYTPLVLGFDGYNPGSTLTSLNVNAPQYSGRVRFQKSGTTNTQGRFTISGDKYFETDNPTDPSHPGNTLGDFTITFAQPVTGFGFYATDIGDFFGQLQLTINRSGDAPLTQLLGSSATTSGVVYFGITTSDGSHPFTSATFHDTTLDNPGAYQDLVGYDNFTVGRLGPAVPEPAMATIWSLSILACGLIVRRTKLLARPS